MKSGFPGFPVEGMKFLRDLAVHNEREWFQPRKSIFDEQVRQPMVELVAAIHKEMVGFAPDYVGDPAKSVYRIYRDTRFSKDKTPYKTHVAALFKRNGWGKDDGAGFFFLVSPEKIEIAGGLYAAMPDALFAVRQYVADNYREFRKIYRRPKVKTLFGDLHGETASRMPKGFDPDHPAADLIKRKQFVLAASIGGDVVTTPELFTQLISRFEAMAPLVHFLNTPLVGLKRHVDAKFLEGSL